MSFRGEHRQVAEAAPLVHLSNSVFDVRFGAHSECWLVGATPRVPEGGAHPNGAICQTLVQLSAANVRFGSEADMARSICDVHSSSPSRHERKLSHVIFFALHHLSLDRSTLEADHS